MSYKLLLAGKFAFALVDGWSLDFVSAMAKVRLMVIPIEVRLCLNRVSVYAVYLP